MTLPDQPSIIPELEQGLVEAAARRAGRDGHPAGAGYRSESAVHGMRRPRRRAWVGSGFMDRVGLRPAIVALASVVAVGSAVAATQPWSPLLGNDVAGHPLPSTSSPPGDQLERLAVLRRAQTIADRGSRVQADLRIIGSQNQGVRTAYVRLLGGTDTGAAIALIPTRAFSDKAAGPPLTRSPDALCVFYPASRPSASPGGADYPCWTTSALLEGRAIGRVAANGGERVFGLVPDGVARVELDLSDGNVITAAPTSNFFDATLPTTSSPFAPVVGVRWFDAAGAAIGPA